ncbi:MAG: LPS assembly lipoprotein LptE [Pseudomonadota bacterium]
MNTKTQRSLALLFIAAFTLLAIEGCGFRLRGSAAVTLSMPITYVQGGATTSPTLLGELRRALESAGVKIAAKQEDAEAVLNVLDEEKGRRVLSVASGGTVQEYELRYGVTFDVKDRDGQASLPAQTVGLERAVSFSAGEALAKGAEEDLLYRDMRRDVIQNILRRLSTINK